MPWRLSSLFFFYPVPRRQSFLLYSFRFVVWYPFFPRLFSIHCSEVTSASLPASLYFFPASRWHRHAMALDPVVTSLPSCASSHFSDVAVVYLIPLLYFLMLHSDWLAYSAWEPCSVLTTPHM
jgi:hypothetical protein